VRHLNERASAIRLTARVLHRTRTRWALTFAVALTAVIWSLATIRSAEDAAAVWGQRLVVPVARVDLEPGRIITDADLEFTERPVAVLAEGIADTPIGRTVRRPIARNETVLEVRLAASGTDGPASLLANEEIGFAVPIDETTPRVRVGDHVTLFAPSEMITTVGRSTGPASRVAEHARVIEVSERSVMIAVDRSEAGAIARSLLSASLVLALAD